MDRISDLPESLRCHILSFLPTKDAVATTILSTAWRNLLPSIPSLRLELRDTYCLHPQSMDGAYFVRFRNFVDRLFSTILHGVPSIHSFHIKCDHFDDEGRIVEWVCAALTRNVKEISLDINRIRNSKSMLNTLSGCNLVSLNLTFDLIPVLPENKFSLPNLKVLTAQYMTLNLVHMLLDSCPVLEQFIIIRFYSSPGQVLRICIPSLRNLVILNSIYWGHGLVLDTPQLEYLDYHGFLASECRVKTLKSLHRASLDLGKHFSLGAFGFNQHAAQLIEACCNAKSLYLSEELIKVLLRSSRPLPQFEKLTHMEAECIGHHVWELLPSLLDSAPSLRTLSAERGFDRQRLRSFKSLLLDSMSISVSSDTRRFSVDIQRATDKPSSSA